MVSLIIGGHGEKTIVHSKRTHSKTELTRQCYRCYQTQEGIIHNIDFSFSQSLAKGHNIQIYFDN